MWTGKVYDNPSTSNAVDTAGTAASNGAANGSGDAAHAGTASHPPHVPTLRGGKAGATSIPAKSPLVRGSGKTTEPAATATAKG